MERITKKYIDDLLKEIDAKGVTAEQVLQHVSKTQQRLTKKDLKRVRYVLKEGEALHPESPKSATDENR